ARSRGAHLRIGALGAERTRRQLLRRDDRAGALGGVLALLVASRRPGRLEVEPEVPVSERRVVAPGGRRDARAVVRVVEIAVVQAVERGGACTVRRRISRFAAVVARLEERLAHRSRAVGVATADDAVQGSGGELAGELRALVASHADTERLGGRVR